MMKDDKIWDREKLLRLPISSLAYLGDAVYELAVRDRLLVRHGEADSRKIYLDSLHYVAAEAQAEALKVLFPELSEEEQALCRRARNHVPKSRPRHADPADYRRATALEALFGWLRLRGENERSDELLERCFAALEKDEEEA